MKWRQISAGTDAMQVGGGVVIRTQGYEDSVALVYVPDTKLIGSCGEYATIEEVIKVNILVPPGPK